MLLLVGEQSLKLFQLALLGSYLLLLLVDYVKDLWLHCATTTPAAAGDLFSVTTLLLLEGVVTAGGSAVVVIARTQTALLLLIVLGCENVLSKGDGGAALVHFDRRSCCCAVLLRRRRVRVVRAARQGGLGKAVHVRVQVSERGDAALLAGVDTLLGKGLLHHLCLSRRVLRDKSCCCCARGRGGLAARIQNDSFLIWLLPLKL